MTNNRIETRHEIYGRVTVDLDELNTSDPLVKVKVINRGNKELKVGKCALAKKGGYIPKKRMNKTRIEQYIPLISSSVRLMMRPQDDWEELYAVASIGLVEADARYEDGSNYAFASYAKPYIMGYLKNHINPERNGLMNIVQDNFDQSGAKVYTDNNATEPMGVMWHFYEALPNMTKKQQQVMKLLYVEGHTEEIAAQILGSPRQVFRGLRDKGIAHVKKRML